MKVLVFTTDVIPLPGLATSGTALRTYGLIRGLRAHGHEVHVSVPRSALQGMTKNFDLSSLSPAVQREIEELRRLAFDSLNQTYLVNELRPDMIICGHWPAYTFQTKPSQAVVVDLAGPHLLERHYQGSTNQMGAVMAKLSIIASADHFIVSGPTQRLYFLSFMLRASVPQPEKRIVEITMPLDPAVPTRDFSSFPDAAYPRFVFGGVFLPWQNPATGLEHLNRTIESKRRGKLKLIGGSHPNYKIKEGVYTKLFASLGKNPAVETMPMLPYERFISELRTSDVALDLMQWNLERELAMTIRSTTYLWAGVPPIYNDYADLGKLIRRYDAGWTVSPSDPAQLDAVLEEIYANPALVKQKSLNASRLAREVFAWDRAVLPLLERVSSRDTADAKEVDIVVDFPDRADLTVTKSRAVEQVFFTRLDGLSRIECRVATHNRELAEPLTFQLFELPGTAESPASLDLKAPRKLLATQTADKSQIKNNEWYALDVPRIADSAGKAYALRIESQSTKSDQCISPWAVKGQPYPLLALFHGDTRLPEASLCMRTTCLTAGS